MKTNEENYIPYGEEWMEELMKMPKIGIIALLRAARLEINEQRDCDDKYRNKLMWVYANSVGSDSIVGLHVCDNYLEWESSLLLTD